MTAVAVPIAVRIAWENLWHHALVTCPDCRIHLELPETAPECPEAWALYGVWKQLWVEAGRAVGLPLQASV